MILIRYALIGLIVYLLVRSFVRFGEGEKTASPTRGPDKKENPPSKKISKEIGEFVDYEEVD